MSELENWSQARPPTAATTAIAITAPASATRLSTTGLREIFSALPVSLPSRCSSQRRSGEEQQREGDPGEQDQQYGDALVDRRLVGDVVGEAVSFLHREHRRQRPQRADRQRCQQPEPISGESDQAAAGDDQAKAGRRASR